MCTFDMLYIVNATLVTRTRLSVTLTLPLSYVVFPSTYPSSQSFIHAPTHTHTQTLTHEWRGKRILFREASGNAAW